MYEILNKIQEIMTQTLSYTHLNITYNNPCLRLCDESLTRLGEQKNFNFSNSFTSHLTMSIRIKAPLGKGTKEFIGTFGIKCPSDGSELIMRKKNQNNITISS